jgi:hypothetical protein
MSNPRVADLHKLNPRFFRSTDIIRDFDDPNACADYFVTPHAVRCLERILAGVGDHRGGKAWRITGDYGSGKSSFALFLSRIASGADIGPRLRRFCTGHNLARQKNHLLPVLVIGRRAPVAETIAVALRDSLKKHSKKNLRGSLGHEIEGLVASCQDGRRARNADQTLLELLPKIATAVKNEGRFKGILLVIDEMGKLLEFAAQYPDRGDIYILQQLAEIAARSAQTPITIVGLLHQGFESYVARQGLTAQREWDKVAGRYDEMLFDHPTDQVAGLVAMALDTHTARIPEDIRREARARMEKAIALGWYGQACSRQHLLDIAPRIYPIDPLALPIIYRTYRRYGQNERSMFSFLHSAEPKALRNFSQKPIKEAGFYGLPEFFDFSETNLTRSFSIHGYGSTWDTVTSVVNGLAADDLSSRRILKSIGLLNLLGITEFVPTEEAISWVAAGNDTKGRSHVGRIIDSLTNKYRLIFPRGKAAGLCLWPHTSVDIQGLQERARGAIPDTANTTDHIENLLNDRPIVARQHYAQTGNMRSFQIRYCKVEALEQPVEIDFSKTDGVILVPLVSNEAERKEALHLAREKRFAEQPFVVAAVPQPLTSLQPYLIELMRWNWIAESTPELSSDRIAREEVSRQRETALLSLQKQIDAHFGVSRPVGHLDIKVFHKGEDKKTRNGREFLRLLSQVANEVYQREPRVFNEMLNRRKPSSTAMSAWGRIMEGLFDHGDIEGFGLDLAKRPPEVALYMSIFQKSHTHRKSGDQWKLELPKEHKDPCNLHPVFAFLDVTIPVGGDGRLQIETLIAELQKPPFGIRAGLIHFIIATYLAKHNDDIALYENGTFCREVGHKEMLRLIHAPERFEIQRVGIKGLRRDIFKQMLHALASVTEIADKESQSVLAVVQPLCRFVAGLPQYSLKTNKISEQTRAVRTVIISAKEPTKLLFVDLPAAVGHPEALTEKEGGYDTAKELVDRIQTSLIDLSTAYDQLLERIGEGLLEALGSQGMKIDSVRKALAGRGTQALVYADDFKLRAFCTRLQDTTLDRLQWLEALGSFVMSKTPKAWTDQDEAGYAWKIREIAEQFQRVEALTYRNGHDPRNSLRIAITRPTGEEQMRVVHYSNDETMQIDEIRQQVAQLLANKPRLAIIAATKELWAAMEKAKPTEIK